MKKLIDKSIKSERQGGYLKGGSKRVPCTLLIVDIDNFIHNLNQAASID